MKVGQIQMNSKWIIIPFKEEIDLTKPDVGVAVDVNETNITAVNSSKIIELYKQGKSIYAIAKLTRYSTSTIYEKLKNCGVKIRNHSEACRNARLKVNLEPSPTLSYILGVLLGDGYITEEHGTGKISLRVTDKIFAEEFRKNLEFLGFRPYQQTIYPKHPNRLPLNEIRAYSKNFYKWYNSIPFEEVKNIAEQYPVEFIRGFFQSEGSITKDGRVFLSNKNTQTINLVRNILNRLGFRNSYYLSSHQIYILGGILTRKRFLRLMKLGCRGLTNADEVNQAELREEVGSINFTKLPTA